MCYRLEEWTVNAMEWPRVWRHCTGCRADSPFVCSEKFRSNANKKLIDVWLIYRCGVCAATWNYPIIARRRVGEIDACLRDAFETNDLALARKAAFDMASLRGYSHKIEMSERVRVLREHAPNSGALALQGDTLRIRLRDPSPMRLDRLLANELNLSRNDLHRRYEERRLSITPMRREGLRRQLIDGMEVCFIATNVLCR